MNLHQDELQLARAYESEHGFEELSDPQIQRIQEFGRGLYKHFRAHPRTHNIINGVLVLFIFVMDAFVLLGLSRLILSGAGGNNFGRILLASLAVGGLHSWLMYSLALFSLHEGAAHNMIFSGTGPWARAAQFLARNLCRIADGAPDYYAECHLAHHAGFGTERDAEFLNFVLPHRYWLTFLPLAAFVNFSDFVVHRPPNYTCSRVISICLSVLYNGAYAVLLYQRYGALFVFLTMLVVLPHVGFYIDRLRQFTEHNLMPLENRNGARSLGVGFWGLLIGGGPWGQPCHLAHHLVSSIPWYQQIRLHFFIRGLLTHRQREQFLLKPVIGFPRLLWIVVRGTSAFSQRRNVKISR